MEKKRLKIGVLVSGIVDPFTKAFCKGAMERAAQLDINLIVLPGKYIDRDPAGDVDIMYEYQHGTILSYATKETLDGVIIAGSCIGCVTTRERLKEFLDRYRDMPCVLAVTKMEGYVGVNFDNYTGIREGLEYLVKYLHYDRIGMVGGPDSNTDAVERKQAFRSVLEEYGIQWEERRYVEGDLSHNCTDVMEHLLDENPDLQAVFCMNDDTAMGFYSVMQKRGMIPGKDLSVMGYDNTDWAKQAYPPLSTVMADAGEIGVKCVEQILRILNGKEPQDVTISTRFIRRDSFEKAESVLLRGIDRNFAEQVTRNFDDIFYRYRHGDEDGNYQNVSDAFWRFMQRLEDWYQSDLDRDINYMLVEADLDGFVNQNTVQYADIENMLAVFRRIYEQMQQEMMSNIKRLQLQKIYTLVYEKIAHSMNYHMGAAIVKEYDTNYTLKLFVRDMLQFDRGNDQSYGLLLGKLDWLKIRNAYIFTYEKPILHLDGEPFSPPEYLYLKAVQRGKEVRVIPAIEQKIAFRDLYSEKVLNVEEPYRLVMIPLFFNELLYGFLLCDLTEGILENGEFLNNQMSAAVKMIELLKNNEQIQEQLENSMAKLRENNIALDTLSKSDGLTGIYNRRGFEDTAERICVRCRQNEQILMVSYVDMNNLKIINDRYGHDEGDFSLKTIADVLAKLIGTNGVVGRIGGDEYACVLPVAGSEEKDTFEKQLFEEFHEFNQYSDKPYNIMVCIGTYLLRPDEDRTLAQALSLADEKLYEMKKHRTREVTKESATAKKGDV